MNEIEDNGVTAENNFINYPFSNQPRNPVFLKIVTEYDLKKHTGFDLIDFDKVNAQTFDDKMTFLQFKQSLAFKYNYEIEEIRIRTMCKLEGSLIKTGEPILNCNETDLGTVIDGLTFMALFVEILSIDTNSNLYDCTNIKPAPHEIYDSNEILLFFKRYEPKTCTLVYQCYINVNVNQKLGSLSSFVASRISKSLSTEIDFYKENYGPDVRQIDDNTTLAGNDIESGDIICFQKKLDPIDAELIRVSTVRAYFKKIRLGIEDNEQKQCGVNTLEVKKNRKRKISQIDVGTDTNDVQRPPLKSKRSCNVM